MFEDVRGRGSGPAQQMAAQMASITVYPIPYTTREGFLSIQVAPTGVTFISQVRVNVSCL